MPKSAQLPITNTLSGGDYTAQIEIGSEKNVANVILDTGSSTLAVWKNKFGDSTTQSTDYVQFVGYGTGHWAGPVLKTAVGFGTGDNYIGLSSTTIAQIQSGQYGGNKQFYPANGILGLAFKSLNTAANVGTSDFPLSNYDTQQKWGSLQEYFENIDPYFTDIEQAHQVENKYAFLTRRSNIHHSTDVTNDPLNGGWFILGGGEEYTDLFTGEFQSLQVVSDQWWNTQFLQLQVGTDSPISIPSLETLGNEYGRDLSSLGSNSIIDSGTNSISLYTDAYFSMIQSFKNLDPSFYQALNRYFNEPDSFSLTQEELSAWPSIFLTLQGSDGSPVTLEMKADTYWQTNATPGGTTAFKIEPSYIPRQNGGPGLQSVQQFPITCLG